MNMDKSWMSLRRDDYRYLCGMRDFLQFMKDNANGRELHKCPCNNCRCNNTIWLLEDEIKFHFGRFGFWEFYTTWTEHGEAPANQQSLFGGNYRSINCDAVGHSNSHVDPIRHLLNDVFPRCARGMEYEVSYDTSTIVSHDYANTSCDTTEVDKYNRLIAYHNTPLYDGSKHTVLSAIMKLMKMKVQNKMTIKGFDANLEFCDEILPPGHCLPDSHYEVRKILRDIGLGYKRIHACRYDCVLFYGEDNKDLDKCPVCHTSRWKDIAKQIPWKELFHFPLKDRLSRMYMSPHIAKGMRWHGERDVTADDILRHPSDGEAWKEFNRLYPHFSREVRNVRLGISTDGFNPFGNMNLSYSIWPVIVVIYNLSPWECMKKEFNLLTLLIPGPKSPGRCLDVYLRPLIDELKDLWSTGIRVYDIHTQKDFVMRAALLWTISDFPGYGMLSAHQTKGYRSCPICLRDVHSSYHCDKCVIMGHRRDLDASHIWRYDKVAFDGTEEHRGPPREWSGDEILQKMNEYNWHVLSNHPSLKKIPGVHPEFQNWSHKSIFFELPYWSKLKIRHCLDVMHIEKNVCESVVGTILDLPGKNKDSYKARKDLQDMNIRPNLWMIGTKMPQAPYTVHPDAKPIVLALMCDVRYPQGYAGNLSRCIRVSDKKITGMKSHDCHVLLQRILPIIIRPFLNDRVVETLIAMSRFFQKLCAREISRSELQEMKVDIVFILCKLERIFPPAFFDTMIHLMIHLPAQALLTGPVHYTWMYPIERQLGQYKDFVMNTASPEGCIAEAYVAHECVTYCELYLRNATEIPNDTTVPPTRDFKINVVSNVVSASGHLSKSYRLTDSEIAEAHWCVLTYCDEAQIFMNLHLEECNNDNLRHKREFSDYFKDWMRKLRRTSYDVYPIGLHLLASQPQAHQIHSICYVNGVKFVCERRDSTLRTQNSGVMTLGGRNGFDSYGILVTVVELLYGNRMKVYLFKCRWFNSHPIIPGSTRIDHGLVSVNMNSSFYADEPFILATMEKQVFYVDDPKAGLPWKVVVRMSHRRIFTPTTLGVATTDGVIDEDDVGNAYQESDGNGIPTINIVRVNDFGFGELLESSGQMIDLGSSHQETDTIASSNEDSDDSGPDFIDDPNDEDYNG